MSQAKASETEQISGSSLPLQLLLEDSSLVSEMSSSKEL